MIELYYKLKIIKLLEKYGKWFYNKTTLYRRYFKKIKGILKLDLEELTEITNNKGFYNQLSKELDYLAYK